jgi:TetR/AcrR family tetracycline transcriptional repressor
LPKAGDAWNDFVIRNARSLRRAMLSVRDGARLISSAGDRVPKLSNAIAQVELLERGGFHSTTAVLALIAVSRYTIGAALEEQASRSKPSLSGSADDADGSDAREARFAGILRDVAAAGQEQEFDLGLFALVRGLDDLNEEREGKA